MDYGRYSILRIIFSLCQTINDFVMCFEQHPSREAVFQLLHEQRRFCIKARNANRLSRYSLAGAFHRAMPRIVDSLAMARRGLISIVPRLPTTTIRPYFAITFNRSAD